MVLFYIFGGTLGVCGLLVLFAALLLCPCRGDFFCTPEADGSSPELTVRRWKFLKGLGLLDGKMLVPEWLLNKEQREILRRYGAYEPDILVLSPEEFEKLVEQYERHGAGAAAGNGADSCISKC